MVTPRVELAAAMAVPGRQERQAQSTQQEYPDLRARDDDLLARRQHIEGT